MISFEEADYPDVDETDGHAKPSMETSMSMEETEDEGKLKRMDSLQKLEYQRMLSRNRQKRERKVSNVAEKEENLEV